MKALQTFTSELNKENEKGFIIVLIVGLNFLLLLGYDTELDGPLFLGLCQELLKRSN